MIRKTLYLLAISGVVFLLNACEFEPELTPITWPTPGDQPFGSALLEQQPQASPVPLAPSPTPSVDSPEDELPISGGDLSVGYDFIDGSQPPTWRIWYEGRQLLVTPNDPGAALLMANFFTQADKRAQAIADYESAKQSAANSKTTGWLGGLGFGAGGLVALLSCGGVPFTFWAMGGTGWTCALGIVGALAGGGSAVMSFIETGQGRNDQQDGLDRWNSASEEANSLINTLEQVSAP